MEGSGLNDRNCGLTKIVLRSVNAIQYIGIRSMDLRTGDATMDQDESKHKAMHPGAVRQTKHYTQRDDGYERPQSSWGSDALRFPIF